jgi:hypothetical protein
MSWRFDRAVERTGEHVSDEECSASAALMVPVGARNADYR